MSTTTKNTKPATRPANFTKKVWDETTFRVYNGLVKLVKGEITLSQFTSHPVVKNLFESCGIAKTPEERQIQTVSLIISMAKDRTSNHVKERHIMPIYTLRKFFNGGYAEKSALPVTYKEPKAPKATDQKAKKGQKKGAQKKTVKFANAEEFLKALPEDKRDELANALVAMASAQMGLEEVA